MLSWETEGGLLLDRDMTMDIWDCAWMRLQDPRISLVVLVVQCACSVHHTPVSIQADYVSLLLMSIVHTGEDETSYRMGTFCS